MRCGAVRAWGVAARGAWPGTGTGTGTGIELGHEPVERSARAHGT
ncbi:hypothetical protein Ae168Ps1_0671c [Pseudonocardia sp. Ae168_Ps1]|nr:hypothetical protein Ae150APs1_0672c [Pseudonocardia sp. Ae150A_Ps1]OLL78265.1 hypothetical protein Ae168Ps1_0671c [Pseudonocardia sp. Ae168_Ps1]OLL87608.1 hypothetical protein Ae263Ps1_4663 [Pseudonocardia sp. Ae263_Ps1]OLL92363.1 hypothetical protein Ae356Ps1_2260c [Pseudonocardia sp. Ae356_Ps1]